MRFIIFTLFLLISSISTASARCYSQAEFEAEQGLRIHSELMVISLNCQKAVPSKGNLYVQYRDFTRQHSSLISSYEQTMKNYFRRYGSGNAERDVNDLRTLLANKVSTDAARMKPNVFCKYYGSRITKALQMDRAKLRRWAGTVFPSHPVSRPICTASR